MAERLEHIARVVRRRSLRRMLLAFGMFSIAENATWLAVTVFAFQRGGVAEAGVVAVVQLAPAVVAEECLASPSRAMPIQRLIGRLTFELKFMARFLRRSRKSA